jgi:predicted O-methyltransferase YrrM
MSYHQHLSFILSYIKNKPSCDILEIGIDQGLMFIPLAKKLIELNNQFSFSGVDVKVQDNVISEIANLKNNSIKLVTENSLTFLPRMLREKQTYDIILLDGDHNYYTVTKELEIISRLMKDDGLIIIDDYEGRWMNVDYWYSTSKEPHYNNVKNMTKPIQTEKRGVHPAVDDFLSINKEWKLFRKTSEQSVVLSKVDLDKKLTLSPEVYL